MNILKNYLQIGLLFTAAALLTVSCGKDKQLEKDIQGTWNAEKDGDGESSARVAHKTSATWTLNVSSTGTYEFKDNNTGSYDLELAQEWYENDSLVGSFTYNIQSDFDWKVEDEHLHIEYNQNYYGSQDEIYEVKTNNEDKIVLNEDQDQSGSYKMSYTDSQGNTININIYYNLTLKK